MSTSVDTSAAPPLDGERLSVGGDRPFLLETDDMWRVAAGSIDVFAVRLGEHGPVGPRTHLVRVTEGRAMFGRPRAAGDRWGLLAVGTSGGAVVRVSRATLDAQDPRSGATAILLAQWIDALYAAMARDKLPAISSDLSLGEPHEVAQGQNIRVREELAWVTHVEGFSRLLGRAGLELGSELLPVSRRVWFEAGAASRITMVATAAIESAPEAWRGLARLHDLVSRFIEGSTREADAAAQERMRQRGAFQQALLRETCEQLASTMDDDRAARRRCPSRAARSPPNALEDPLLGELPHGRLPRSGSPSKPDPRTHVTRPRRVTRWPASCTPRGFARGGWRCAGSWWTEDSGPLLAFRAPDKQPVALLRDGRSHLPPPRSRPIARPRGWIRRRSRRGSSRSPHSFYRPFPDAALRMRDVLRFGLRGSRRDIFVVVATIVCAALVGMVPAIATGVLVQQRSSPERSGQSSCR